jgi:hypothetical protein
MTYLVSGPVAAGEVRRSKTRAGGRPGAGVGVGAEGPGPGEGPSLDLALDPGPARACGRAPLTPRCRDGRRRGKGRGAGPWSRSTPDSAALCRGSGGPLQGPRRSPREP